MKVGLIQQRVGSTNKIQSAKPNTYYYSISFGGEDEFVVRRQYKKYHEQTVPGNIGSLEIDKLYKSYK